MGEEAKMEGEKGKGEGKGKVKNPNKFLYDVLFG